MLIAAALSLLNRVDSNTQSYPGRWRQGLTRGRLTIQLRNGGAAKTWMQTLGLQWTGTKPDSLFISPVSLALPHALSVARSPGHMGIGERRDSVRIFVRERWEKLAPVRGVGVESGRAPAGGHAAVGRSREGRYGCWVTL